MTVNLRSNIRRTSVSALICVSFALSPLLASQSLPARAAEPVSLATHNLFPYGYKDDSGEFVGSAVDVVRCVMDRVGLDWNLKVTGWKRAQRMVERGSSHGFFAASQNSERDGFAVLTDVIAEQNWSWFLRADTSADPKTDKFKREATVSSRFGANMHDWLMKNEYRVPLSPPDSVNDLLDMLLDGEIDAALANEQSMTSVVRERKAEGKVRVVLNRSKPLGVYFSKQFLDTAPQFLSRFNSEVPSCRSAVSQKVYIR